MGSSTQDVGLFTDMISSPESDEVGPHFRQEMLVRTEGFIAGPHPFRSVAVSAIERFIPPHDVEWIFRIAWSEQLAHEDGLVRLARILSRTTFLIPTIVTPFGPGGQFPDWAHFAGLAAWDPVLGWNEGVGENGGAEG